MIIPYETVPLLEWVFVKDMLWNWNCCVRLPHTALLLAMAWDHLAMGQRADFKQTEPTSPLYVLSNISCDFRTEDMYGRTYGVVSYIRFCLVFTCQHVSANSRVALFEVLIVWWCNVWHTCLCDLRVIPSKLLYPQNRVLWAKRIQFACVLQNSSGMLSHC